VVFSAGLPGRFSGEAPPSGVAPPRPVFSLGVGVLFAAAGDVLRGGAEVTWPAVGPEQERRTRAPARQARDRFRIARTILFALRNTFLELGIAVAGMSQDADPPMLDVGWTVLRWPDGAARGLPSLRATDLYGESRFFSSQTAGVGAIECVEIL
jgi:hypothetical protein